MESGSDSEQKDLIPVISKCREIVLEVAGRSSEDAGDVRGPIEVCHPVVGHPVVGHPVDGHPVVGRWSRLRRVDSARFRQGKCGRGEARSQLNC